MIKLGVLEVPKSIKEQSVNMVYSAPPIFNVSPQRQALVFKVPKSFLYQSDHAVPWRYETIVESNTGADHGPTMIESMIPIQKSTPVFQVAKQSPDHIDPNLPGRYGTIMESNTGIDHDPLVS